MGADYQFVKVRCIDKTFTGDMGKFRFKNGISYWMHTRHGLEANGCGAARPVEGGNCDPFWATMNFHHNGSDVPLTEDICIKEGRSWDDKPANPTIVYAFEGESPKPIAVSAPKPTTPEPEPAHIQPEVNATDSAIDLMAENGIEAWQVEGSGRGGRITKGDVEKFLAEGGGVV